MNKSTDKLSQAAGSSIQPEVMSIHQIVAATICRRLGCDKNVQHIFFHYDIVWQTTER